MHDNEERRVKATIQQALDRLVERDANLFRLDVNERTITERLAEYIQELLPEWHVDPEYNRIRNLVKEVELDGAITPRLLTVKQAAVYCACSIWAIRQVIWSKELPACMIGRRLLIDRGDLDRFIDTRLRERAS